MPRSVARIFASRDDRMFRSSVFHMDRSSEGDGPEGPSASLASGSLARILNPPMSSRMVRISSSMLYSVRPMRVALSWAAFSTASARGGISSGGVMSTTGARASRATAVVNPLPTKRFR